MTQTTQPKTREEKERHRYLLLEILPKNAVAAEIGVWRGLFSKSILKICQPKELHLIDPWAFQPEFSQTLFGDEERREQLEELYHRVSEKFQNEPRVTIHRKFSDDAFATFPDNYFDWVYIDGNHYSPFADRDIQNAYRTVKEGGLITGDDYHVGKKQGGIHVHGAVNNLVKRLGKNADFELIKNQFIICLNHKPNLDFKD